MKYLAFLIILTASCGTDNSNNSGAEAGSPGYALALNTLEDRPPCTPDNIGQLIYVKQTAQFFGCEASSWELIDIKGEKGESGEAGIQGVAGAQGKAGDSGQDAVQEAQVEVNNFNVWIDPVIGTKWFVGGGESLNSGLCANGQDYYSPSDNALYYALDNGFDLFVRSLGVTRLTYEKEDGGPSALRYITTSGWANAGFTSDVAYTVCYLKSTDF